MAGQHMNVSQCTPRPRHLVYALPLPRRPLLRPTLLRDFLRRHHPPPRHHLHHPPHANSNHHIAIAAALATPKDAFPIIFFRPFVRLHSSPHSKSRYQRPSWLSLSSSFFTNLMWNSHFIHGGGYVTR